MPKYLSQEEEFSAFLCIMTLKCVHLYTYCATFNFFINKIEIFI